MKKNKTDITVPISTPMGTAGGARRKATRVEIYGKKKGRKH